jgi:hypothetical protein
VGASDVRSAARRTASPAYRSLSRALHPDAGGDETPRRRSTPHGITRRESHESIRDDGSGDLQPAYVSDNNLVLVFGKPIAQAPPEWKPGRRIPQFDVLADSLKAVALPRQPPR